MKKPLIITLAVVLLVAAAASAQTTKFNKNGDMTWISGLLDDRTGCEAVKTVSGTITRLEPLRGTDADMFEFTVKPRAGKAMKFNTSISHHAGAIIVDLENMLQPKTRVKVKARQCGSGGYWTAEEIWRQ